MDSPKRNVALASNMPLEVAGSEEKGWRGGRSRVIDFSSAPEACFHLELWLPAAPGGSVPSPPHAVILFQALSTLTWLIFKG